MPSGSNGSGTKRRGDELMGNPDRLTAILERLSLEQFRLVLRFAEFLAKEQRG